MDKEKFKTAFTLAEVLITLGIIGVVAAITIPSLISNIEDRALLSQFKKTYSMLNQALTFTNYERGVEYKCYTTNNSLEAEDTNVYSRSECKEFYEDYLKHLKYLKVENIQRYPYKTKAEVLAEGGDITNTSCSFVSYNNKKYTLTDGSFLYINGTHNNNHMALFLLVDINGEKGPNKWGYDVFYLTPTKRKNGSIRIYESVCTMWEKDGKRAANILNNNNLIDQNQFPN